MSNTIRYFAKVAGIPRDCKFTFADRVTHRATIEAFKARAGLIHLSTKRRSYAAAFLEFRRLYEPVEWFCRTEEGPNFKDDSIEVWYVKSPAMHDYEVIVGNIGTVYSGTDEAEAHRVHDVYVRQAQGGMGRAAGETVTIMRDGEINMETES